MATRSGILTFRVKELEMAMIESMARSEKLPTDTFVRRRLLLEAEQKGVTASTEAQLASAKSE
jgi:hypothetical protein